MGQKTLGIVLFNWPKKTKHVNIKTFQPHNPSKFQYKKYKIFYFPF